jgi:hypothetical protein
LPNSQAGASPGRDCCRSYNNLAWPFGVVSGPAAHCLTDNDVIEEVDREADFSRRHRRTLKDSQAPMWSYQVNLDKRVREN